jgi:hypothetical protein
VPKNSGNFCPGHPTGRLSRESGAVRRVQRVAPPVLPRLLVNCVTPSRALRVGQANFPALRRRRSQQTAVRSGRKAAIGRARQRMLRPVRMPCGTARPDPARCGCRHNSAAPATDGLSWLKLACQAGFVISFYDLSKTGNRATVQRRTDTPNRNRRHPASSTSTRPKGPSPKPSGRGLQRESFVNAAAEIW